MASPLWRRANRTQNPARADTKEKEIQVNSSTKTASSMPSRKVTPPTFTTLYIP